MVTDHRGELSSWRFLYRPRWLVGHALCAVAVIIMATLGLWQLDRLDERRTFNALLDERAAMAPVAVEELLAPGADVDAATIEYRTVRALGIYLVDEGVLVRNRSLDGRPGVWVLTPLRLADGRLLLVNRGFVEVVDQPTLPAQAEPPTGSVVVEGPLIPGQIREGIGPVDPPTGRLETVARADIARIAAQLDGDTLPLLLQLRAQAPAPAQLPVTLAEPARDEGPHLSYAGQWFLFASLTLVSYGLIVRRAARRQSSR